MARRNPAFFSERGLLHLNTVALDGDAYTYLLAGWGVQSSLDASWELRAQIFPDSTRESFTALSASDGTLLGVTIRNNVLSLYSGAYPTTVGSRAPGSRRCAGGKSRDWTLRGLDMAAKIQL